MATAGAIVVAKLKWDGSESARWPASLVACGPWRLCWYTPAGTRRERPRRGRIEVTRRDEIAASEDGRWWAVTARLDPEGEPVYLVDASTPPALQDGTLRFCDLDLDLDLEGASVSLRDLPDFRARAREMGYPPDVQRRAWEGLGDAADRHRRGAWPFDGTLAHLLRERAERPLPASAHRSRRR
jgi:hypothetical protein